MAHGESDLTPDPLHARLRAAAAGAGGGARRTPECPDPVDIATLVTSDGEAAATFLLHASTCDYCGPQVDAAMGDMADRDEDRALLDGLHTGTPEWRKQMSFRLAAGKKAPATSRRWVWTAAGVAAAAALIVVAIRVASPGATRPELQDLVGALNAETQRPVDGRLTGGFSYAAPPTLLRGPTAEAAPRVRIAAAQLEEAARANDTAATQAAVGVGFLAVGELDKAVDALEGAVLQSPTDARYQSDLAAAYLARAKWTDRAEDWPKALAAAERAVKADPALVEAQFNRALALEGLHLIDAAIEAWTSYQAIETESRWSAEADEHVRRLREQLSAPKPQSNQELRERIEDQLLMQWGEAMLSGDGGAATRLLDEAELASAALVAAGGDTMAHDQIALIRTAARAKNKQILRAHALGHSLFGRGRASFLANQLTRASDDFNRAAEEFAKGQSPYQHWGPIFDAIRLRIAGLNVEANKRLAVIPESAVAGSYFHLAGRLWWTQAVIAQNAGRFDETRNLLAASVEAFGRSLELENQAAVEAGLAEAEWFLGRSRETWAFEIKALSKLRVMPINQRRTTVLLEGAAFALGDGQPEVALHFHDTLIRSLEAAGQSAARADAYMRRARAKLRLSDGAGARDDLDRAQQAVAGIPDAPARTRASAELNRARGEILAADSPSRALEAIGPAIDYFRSAGPTNRLAELLLLRGSILEGVGSPERAIDDFVQATDAFDRDRSKLQSPLDRRLAFQQQRQAFQGIVRFHAVTRGRHEEALRAAERGRLLVGRPPDMAAPALSDPIEVRRAIPGHAAVVYLSVLDDRTLAWVLTADSVDYFSAQIGSNEARLMAEQLLRDVTSGAAPKRLSGPAARLQATLVSPALKLVGNRELLVFVLDGPLASLPIAGLQDEDGAPLVQRRALAVSPSLTAFVAGYAQLQRFVPRTVLAVGDGSVPGIGGLPRLHQADREAADVANLYADATLLIGSAATKARVFASDVDVVHFAGHTVANLDFPLLSRILLAPDSDRGDGGVLLASEVLRHRFNRTGVVVLATCSAASGRHWLGDGVLSIARMFMEAGVPAVVANLLPTDEAAKNLFLILHRELLATSNPFTALRSAQLAFKEAQPEASARLWAGLVLLIGATNHGVENAHADH